MSALARTLVLASASPRRRELLRALKLPFRIAPSHVSEEVAPCTPRRLVLELALRKARAVAGRRKRALVLGADTIVVCRGEVLNKPIDREDGRRILRSLNGRWHRVYTGVALVDSESGRWWREAAVTRVKARRLTAEELERFVGRHMDKAGAYAVQDHGDPFIERIVGPFDNVVGLPLASVRSLLRRALCARRRKTAR
ncbi:MAG: nucleoside triphosphate pyrophosphatase [Elusimicrobiota bacterium]|jgi:septum formation protein